MKDIGYHSGVRFERTEFTRFEDDESLAEQSALYKKLRDEALKAEAEGKNKPKFNPEEWGLE